MAMKETKPPEARVRRGIAFKCPRTGLRVHGWIEVVEGSGQASYSSVECSACKGIHLVDPATGQTLADRAGSKHDR